MNNLAYGPGGKLYATWCWRETAGGANHDIMYAFSNDGGYVWLNGESNTIRIFTSSQEEEPQTLLTLNVGAGEDNIVRRATGNPSTITLDSPGVKVVTLDRYYGLMNQQTAGSGPAGSYSYSDVSLYAGDLSGIYLEHMGAGGGSAIFSLLERFTRRLASQSTAGICGQPTKIIYPFQRRCVFDLSIPSDCQPDGYGDLLYRRRFNHSGGHRRDTMDRLANYPRRTRLLSE